MLKLSKTGITVLKRQYKSVLMKCLLINAGIMFAAGAANATDYTTRQTIASGETGSYTAEDSFKNIATGTGTLGWGGSIMSSGTLTINGTTFEGNSAYVGGAISDAMESTGPTTIKDAIFKNNHSRADAGAVGIYAGKSNGNAENKITGTTFEGNTAGIVDDTGDSDGGGAVFVGGNANLTLENDTFTGNKSSARGGAISIRHVGADEAVKISGSTFEGNESGNFGGAIANVYKAIVKVTDTTFDGNKATKAGGAIYNGVDMNYGTNNNSTDNGTINISGDVSFTDNEAGEKGGAIFNDEGGTVNISATTHDISFSGNTANNVANDIFNLGILNFNAGSGKTISLAGGIDGDSEHKGTTNISGTGSVQVANALKNQNVKNTGNLVLDNAKLDGTTISGDGSVKIAGDSEVKDTTLADQTMEVETGEELKLTGVTLDETVTGKGTLTNAFGGTLNIKHSHVNVNVNNAGILYSDPTYYTKQVVNTGTATFDGDIFDTGSSLENNATVNLKNGTSFVNSNGISGTGVTNLVNGTTAFATTGTSNTNTINLASGADWSGVIDGGTVNAVNGAIDTVTGTVASGTKLYLDAKLGDTGSVDAIAGGTIKKISLTGDSSYGANDSVTVTAASGSTFDSNVEIDGMNYYTAKTVSGNTLTLSDKLVNTSGLYDKIGADWTDGNYIQNAANYTNAADTTHLTVGQALKALDTQVKQNTDDITVAAAGKYISTGTNVAGNLGALDTAVNDIAKSGGTIDTKISDALGSYTTTAKLQDGSTSINASSLQVGGKSVLTTDSTITHNKISDWTAATSGFQTASDVSTAVNAGVNGLKSDIQNGVVVAKEATSLTGVTATAAQLNVLNGSSATTADFNKLHNVTATADELNVLHTSTATTADLNKLHSVTADATELNYVDGVTSNIQDQLNAKTTLDAVLTDAANQTGTHLGATIKGTKVDNATHADSADTATKATQDGDGNVISATYAKSASLGTAAYTDSTAYATAAQGATAEAAAAAVADEETRAKAAESALNGKADTAIANASYAVDVATAAQSSASYAASAAAAAQTTANTAKSTAESAYALAGSAEDQAKQAQSTANAAYSKADAAQTAATNEEIRAKAAENALNGKADSAIANASYAVDVAGAAQSTASYAASAAAAAQTTANSAKDRADSAYALADMANGKADQAQTTANAAKTAAENAQTTADQAKATANVAYEQAFIATANASYAASAAAAAQSTANAAKTAAEGAQASADAAQASADLANNTIGAGKLGTGAGEIAGTAGNLEGKTIGTSYTVTQAIADLNATNVNENASLNSLASLINGGSVDAATGAYTAGSDTLTGFDTATTNLTAAANELMTDITVTSAQVTATNHLTAGANLAGNVVAVANALASTEAVVGTPQTAAAGTGILTGYAINGSGDENSKTVIQAIDYVAKNAAGLNIDNKFTGKNTFGATDGSQVIITNGGSMSVDHDLTIGKANAISSTENGKLDMGGNTLSNVRGLTLTDGSGHTHDATISVTDKGISMDKSLEVSGSIKATGIDTSTANTVKLGGENFTTAVTGNMTVSGDTTMTGGLTVNGDTTLKDTTVGGDLTVTGDTTLDDLAVTGAATFGDTTGKFVDITSGAITVHDGTGSTNVTASIANNGDITTKGKLDVAGLASLDGGIDVNEKFTVNATDGTVTLKNGTNTASLAMTEIKVADPDHPSDPETIANVMKVTGTGLFTGDVASEKGFVVAQKNGSDQYEVKYSVDQNGNINSKGTLSVSDGKFAVDSDGAVDAANGAFSVDKDGNTTVGDTTKYVKLNADGTLETSGAATIGNGLKVSAGGADITGDSSVDGKLDVTGDFSVATNKFTVASDTGNTTVAGKMDIEGDTTIGDKFSVKATDGSMSAAGGNLTVDGSGAITSKSWMSVADGNFKVNSTGGLTTTSWMSVADGNFKVNSTGGLTTTSWMSVANGKMTVNSDGAIKAADGKFTVDKNGAAQAESLAFNSDGATVLVNKIDQGTAILDGVADTDARKETMATTATLATTIGKLDDKAAHGITDVSDVASAISTLSQNVETATGGTFAGAVWNGKVKTDAMDYTYGGTVGYANIMNAVSTVASNVGAAVTNTYNGVKNNATVNANIDAVNAKIGNWNDLHKTYVAGASEGNALTNGGDNEPDTVVAALNNIDATLGTIHGLSTKLEGQGTYQGNLADGTTVEQHLAALDTAIGDRSRFANTHYAKDAESVVDAIDKLDTGLYDLDHDVRRLRHHFEAGMASAAALSALQANARATGNTQLAIGSGSYRGHGAMAIGGFHWFTDNLLFNAGVAYDSNEPTYRMGVTYSW